MFLVFCFEETSFGFMDFLFCFCVLNLMDFFSYLFLSSVFFGLVSFVFLVS